MKKRARVHWNQRRRRRRQEEERSKVGGKTTLSSSMKDPGRFGGAAGHVASKRMRISTPLLLVVGLALVFLIESSMKESYVLDKVKGLSYWISFEMNDVDYGENGVLDEYPDKSAKMRLADIPPPRTGQRKEPSVREAFPLLKWPTPAKKGSSEAFREDISRQIETIHLQNTTQEEVDYYVTRGYVVVVDDMAKENGMLGWSCEDYAKKWPDGFMRGEYPAPWLMNNKKEGFMLHLRDTSMWIDTIRPTWYMKYNEPKCLIQPKCMQYYDNAAKSCAYVWHVKTEEETPQELQDSVREHWRPPYYMDSAQSQSYAMTSFEMWFAPVGAGTFAHSDRYCETHASMQLKGSKTWRIMNPGPRVDTYKDRIRYGDGEIYAEDGGKEDQQWNPELLVTVPEGGGIIFPPYAYHETVTNNAECSVATTFGHPTPSASRYLRYFMPRLLNQHLGYEVGCHRYWDDLALWTMKKGKGVPDAQGNILPGPSQEYLDRDTAAWGESKMYKVLPTTDKELMTVRFKKILKDVDTDGNDVIDAKELWNFVVKEYDLLTDDGGRRSMRREYLAYYDLDDSGDISKEELWDGWEHWNINSAYAILTHAGGLWKAGYERKEW